MESLCSRLIPALDKMDLPTAVQLVQILPPTVNIIKVNDLADKELEPSIKSLSSFWKNTAIHAKADPLKAWVDWKLHDTPDTVKARAARIEEAGGYAVTVHASGGPRMIAAAKDSGLYVIAVTALTSLTDDDIKRLFQAQPEAVVRLMAEWALEGGADALVCSPKQVANLHQWRQQYDHSVQPALIVPGTRSPGKDTHDQKQVDTPEQTIRNGADYLVVGRQVTQSSQPMTALLEIAKEIQPAVQERIQAGTWKEY